MSEVIIRKVIDEDALSLCTLSAQLGYPQTLSEMQNRLSIYLTQPEYGVFVAEKDSKVIGFVAFTCVEMFVLNKRNIRIQGLIVDSHYRGLGVGKKLMQVIEGIAHTVAPCKIDLTSGVRRAKDGTHEFYKTLGYENEGERATFYLRKEITADIIPSEVEGSSCSTFSGSNATLRTTLKEEQNA